MAESEAPTGAQAQQDAPSEAPQFVMRAQYVKDLSFENPRAPASFEMKEAPQMQVNINVGASDVGVPNYEIVINISAEAKSDDKVAFIVDLSYGGVFLAANIPPEQLQPLLLVEGPRLLFPFARRVIADATRDGGFPPLMLEPINFAALYEQQLQSAQAQGGNSEDTPPN